MVRYDRASGFDAGDICAEEGGKGLAEGRCLVDEVEELED